MMPTGDTSMFNNIDPQGNPTANIINQLVNFGWEYVYHCHILSHEEMDMMRPVSVALPPAQPNGLAFSITETSFVVQRSTNGTTFTDVGTITSSLSQPNIHEPRIFTDPTATVTTAYLYRIVARNTVGYGNGFPTVTVTSVSPTAGVNAPAAPSNVVGTLQAGPQVRVTWTDNSTNETRFILERQANGGAFTQIATPPARSGTGTVTFTDLLIAPGDTYIYRVSAQNVAGTAGPADSAPVAIPAVPALPSAFVATNGVSSGNARSVVLTWTDNATNETGYTVQRATNSSFTGNTLNSVTVTADTVTLTQTGLSRNTGYYYRIRANNGPFVFTAWVNATPFPNTTLP
jgi:hypothetical protein